MSTGDGRLTDLLSFIQSHLHDRLDLNALCQVSGLSPAQIHRLFRAHVGETPRAYRERLRVELAAFRLLVHDETILNIALDCGFQNHETFIRAFRRRFGMVPGRYRTQARARTAETLRRRSEQARGGGPPILSGTQPVSLKGRHIAFIRHCGPYETVPISLFGELHDWACRRQLPGPRIWLGIGLDAPGVTDPGKLRFDAALAVDEPFASGQRICCRWLEGGPHALTTFFGGFASLPAAYREIFERLNALAGYRAMGLPAIEIYRPVSLGGLGRAEHTDIYLPLERVGGAAD